MSEFACPRCGVVPGCLYRGPDGGWLCYACLKRVETYQPQVETLPDDRDMAALRAENDRLRDLLRKCEPALAFVVVRDPGNADLDLVELWASVREETGGKAPP